MVCQNENEHMCFVKTEANEYVETQKEDEEEQLATLAS